MDFTYGNPMVMAVVFFVAAVCVRVWIRRDALAKWRLKFSDIGVALLFAIPGFFLGIPYP